VRILVDYRPALRERTGVGEFVHELVRALADPTDVSASDEIVIFTSSWKDRPVQALRSEIPAAQVIDRRIPVRALAWAWNNYEFPPVEWLSGPCDVVHSQSPMLIPSARAAQVVTIHDLDFLRHPENVDAEIRRDYPRLARAHARRAHAVIVSSQYAAAEVARELGLPPSHVHVCPPGSPSWAPAVASQQAVSRGRRILFMGTLGPRKNVGTLLEAYARLRSRVADAPPLTLAGHTTPASVRWEARANEPPLAGHVEITGYVDAARRIELFADARMLVLPSYEEGFGLPVLEAMACGVPVVVSSRGSLPEVAGPAADPVEPDDAEGLTARMMALLDDATARAASRRGLAQAALYSWRACAAAARGAYAAAMEVHAGRC
jgi:glycosyltransferase involved in cell wall biosynthesis